MNTKYYTTNFDIVPFSQHIQTVELQTGVAPIIGKNR